MALPRNKLIPILSFVGLGLVVFIAIKAFRSPDAPVQAGARMTAVPNAAAPASGSSPSMFSLGQTPPADGDKPTETMKTLAARLADNDRVVKEQANDNKAMRMELDRLKAQMASGGVAYGPTPTGIPANAVLPGAKQPATAASGTAPQSADPLERSIGSVMDSFDALAGKSKPQAASRMDPGAAPNGMPPGLGFDGLQTALPGNTQRMVDPGPTTSYTTIKPMGYVDRGEKAKDGPRFVRAAAGSAGNDAGDARSALPPAAEKKDESPIPYFTIPENATLTRVVAMTAVVGRVPIDGKVQDPMQFKAIVGRENLAANGKFVPDDISGIVISGTAVGDMTMSCSEGHIHSMTFVFNDGAIRTVSTRKGSAGTTRDKALGYISDEFGNPCISGRFVTNAPAYLTDVVGLKTLSTASKAYAAAQTSTTDSGLTGNSTSSVTGNRGAFVLGQAAASGVDEVTNWLFSRMKNSFDAVVTPAGQRIVVHIDQEIAIDRAVNPRRLDHTNTAQTTGGRHGLD